MSLGAFAGATGWLVVPLAEMWKSGRAADICMRGGSRENVLARFFSLSIQPRNSYEVALRGLEQLSTYEP